MFRTPHSIRARFAMLFALTAIGAGWAPAAHAGSPHSFGFSDNASGMSLVPGAEDAQHGRAAGGTTHRTVIRWSAVESTRGQWSLVKFDNIYALDLKAGIKPLFVLMAAPNWARDPSTACDGDGCNYPPSPEHLSDWAAAVAFLAKRYPQLAGIELWNEPNLTRYWKSGPDPAYYTEMVKRATAAVRASGSTVPVLAGALSNYPGPDGGDGISYRSFLDGMYKSGLAGHLDGLSLHPYPEDIDEWRTFKALTEVRELREAAGDGTPLWISELGVTTSGDAGPGRLSENDQGVLLARLLGLLKGAPDVRATYVHTLHELTLWGMESRQRGLGVMRPDRTPKPAYCALAAANATSYICPAEVAPPVPAPVQVKRWEAQELLQAAADAARAYRRTRGSYAGLDSTVLSALDPRLNRRPADGNLAPGAKADPSRIGVWLWQSAAGQTLLLCNTSRADRSYCVQTVYGAGWTYGHATGNVFAAAGATTNGASATW